jgi:hypothetical protein
MHKTIFVIGAALTLMWHANLNAAELPQCEATFRPKYFEMLPLTPPHTEYEPHGFAVVNFIVGPNGLVSDVTLTEWHVEPSDDFMHQYMRNSVLAWKYPKRQSACRVEQTITLELADNA